MRDMLIAALRCCFLGLLVPALLSQTAATEWCVATNGTPGNSGSKESPWDLSSVLDGQRQVKPGDTVWVTGGTYRYPDRRLGTGYPVRLAGTQDRPVRVQAAPGQRATIDGGLTLTAPSSYLWIQGLEITVSENLTLPRRLQESGSSPKSYGRPWGGLNVHAGTGCKFINLVIHDNAQGVSWWAGSHNTELYGCIIYDNGWEAPDRGHGHAIYTQNNEGIKTIADCIMTGGYGYTLHAYGSSRADVNNYLVRGNIAYDAGTFLIGGGKPSRGIRVFTNFLSGINLDIGYNAPTNEDCELRGNIVLNARVQVKNYRQVAQTDNLVLAKTDARPGATTVVLRPNRYDSTRAHLVIFNWEKKAVVPVDLSGFVSPGQKYRLLSPRDVFGAPVIRATWTGDRVLVPVTGEFAAFVLAKNP